MHESSKRISAAVLCTVASWSVGTAAVFAAPTDPPIVAQRTVGEFVIDGRLDDAGWQDATPIDKASLKSKQCAKPSDI